MADLAWATSVVGSLPRVGSAETAQIIVARQAFFRGDTAAVRARLLPVLRARDRDWTRWPTHPFGHDLFFWVVRSGGADEALTWVRALPSPASRAAGSLELGEAVVAFTDAGQAMRFNNALHACRDDF